MLEQPAALFQALLLQALKLFQAPSAVGLGLFLALTGLGGNRFYRHLLFTLAGLNGRLHFGLFFGQFLILPCLLLFLSAHSGACSFTHPGPPRQLVQLAADGLILADGPGFAVFGHAVKALAAGLHTGLDTRKALGVLLAPRFFLRQKGIALAHCPLDFPILGAGLFVVHVKPLVAHPVQLQGGAHALGLGWAHGGKATEPRGTQGHVVIHHLELCSAQCGACVDNVIVDALGLAAPSDGHGLEVLRVDVDAGLKVRGAHFSLKRGLALNGDFKIAQLLGVLHACRHHHCVGSFGQQTVLPSLRQTHEGQPPRQQGGQAKGFQSAAKSEM